MKVYYRIITITMLLLILNYNGDAQSRLKQDAGSSGNHKSMTAVKITESPKIDGKLDDAVWDQAVFSGEFIQREPVEGEPATEITEVAMIYDDKNLYVAARCFDSEPDKIIATEMRRDERMWNDDNFEVIIDTFNDKRNAFYFTTNPLAMRRDGKVSDEGRIENSDWDGVWMCKVSRDERGWFVEMAIPWQTLRFKEGDNIKWGANFVRKIQRKNEDDYWRLIPRYAGRNGRFRMSEAGEVSGFEGLKMGGKYELKPFLRGGIQKDSGNDLKTEKIGDSGLDLKVN
ncbi:MAG: carbohydrate binding family 9 domain-containing protein, partial [bacterium]|nr:carbohydrate binding family 9 domain-containing protein [bacterium]